MFSMNTARAQPIFGDSFEAGSVCAWANPWYDDLDDDGWGDSGGAPLDTLCPAPALRAPNDGDCRDDLDQVNPAALELPGNGLDDDCDAVTDEDDLLCDAGLLVGEPDPWIAARALGFCQIGTPAGRWGLLDAEWVRADGTASASDLNVGLLPSFGNIAPAHGERLLVLSTGHARDLASGDDCGAVSCATSGAGVAPPFFPQSVPGCANASQISDDVGLRLRLKAPSNRGGFRFAFKFHSFEWPHWVCTEYNDQFLVLVDPVVPGSINGNVTFDSTANPVSVNVATMEVCDPSDIGLFASNCNSGTGTCPSPPNPYCAQGVSELVGTGFDIWGLAGATTWLETSVPITPGAIFTIDFVIFDSGDDQLDSTVLLDHFEWIEDPGSIGTESGG